MVPFERALVSFYRLFIVTFPLSLRVSEILPDSDSVMQVAMNFLKQLVVIRESKHQKNSCHLSTADSDEYTI